MHDRLVQAVLSPSTQRKLSTARSFNDALGLNATVPERVLAELDGRAAGTLEEQSRLALAEVPQAAEWADRFTSGVRPSTKGFRRQAAPTIVQDAVEGIAQACVPDPDGMLHDLLV